MLASNRLYATYSVKNGIGVICLTDSNGNWRGAHRVEFNPHRHDSHYDQMYAAADLEARLMGGRLERFSQDPESA